MIHTSFCDLVGIEHPVVQGGMAWLGTAELVSAVSEAGGLGTVASGGANGDWVREQIRRTRQRTNKPIAVNVFMGSRFHREIIDVIVEEQVPVAAFGAGDSRAFFPLLKNAGIKVICVIPSVALARRMESEGADALVAAGTESGGHIGEITTMALVPQVVDAVRIPVIAAGGIADGRGMAAAMMLGAQGVQLGTRFVCSTECIAHPDFKQHIIQANDQDAIVTYRSSGRPTRCLNNELARQFLKMEKDGAPTRDMDIVGKGKLRAGILEGDVEWGCLMAGQISGMIRDIKPCREIINGIVSEAEETMVRTIKNTTGGMRCQK